MSTSATLPLVRPDVEPIDPLGPRVAFVANTRDEEARAALQSHPASDEVDAAERVARRSIACFPMEIPSLAFAWGGMVGAVAGLFAGRPGAAVGAALGALVGALCGRLHDELSDERARRDDALDRAIGVAGGDLGAAPPDAPPAVLGHFGAASMGLGGGREPTREFTVGPLASIDARGGR
jgi:hypothetical protein